MVTGLWGKKIGMTQIFTESAVVPVTVIDASHWIATQIKTVESDGYVAVQIGCLRNRYQGQAFDASWLKNLKRYFVHVREVRVTPEQAASLTVGGTVDFVSAMNAGDKVDVFGLTKGCGFAGVVRRHDFTGARASHGSKMGNRTGSLSHMRAHGRVIPGKKMPGHMGLDRVMMKNLSVVRVEPQSHIMLVKGSVPGKAGSLVFVRKA